MKIQLLEINTAKGNVLVRPCDGIAAGKYGFQIDLISGHCLNLFRAIRSAYRGLGVTSKTYRRIVNQF